MPRPGSVAWCLLTVLCCGALVSADAAGPDAASRATDLNNRGILEAQAGRFEAGIAFLRQALQTNPQDAQIRRNLSGMLTDWAGQLVQHGRTAEAEKTLREAVGYEANGKAYFLLGDLAYFSRSAFEEAVGWWKRGYGLLEGPDRRMAADRIAQAQRDQVIEHGFLSGQTEHFDIRVQSEGQAALPALGNLLETQYARVADSLGTGPAKITVIIYTQQDLQRAYNQRDWAIGFYDGRLRLRWNEVGNEAAPVLVAHELTHAFLYTRYPVGLPIWVHEGLAQYEEGRPLAPEELQLEQGVASGTAWIPLKWLDRRFTQPTGLEDVARAYTQARYVVRTLLERHGMPRFTAFLEALNAGTAVDAAYEQAFAPSKWALADQGNFD